MKKNWWRKNYKCEILAEYVGSDIFLKEIQTVYLEQL